MNQKTWPLAVALLGCCSAACAALAGRDLDGIASNGFEAYYDDTLNITWLADANYFNTQYREAVDKEGFIKNIVSSASTIAGHKVTGSAGGGDIAPLALNWWGAMAWAQSLDVFGYKGWRLPSVIPMNGGNTYSTVSRADGQSDVGYNITSPRSELAYMYYVNLGLRAAFDRAGLSQGGAGVPFGKEAIFEVPNADGVVIRNLKIGTYWYGVESSAIQAWNFGTRDGGQSALVSSGKDFRYMAWAVRDGDVAAVPEPCAAVLAAAAVLPMIWLLRRRGYWVRA